MNAYITFSFWAGCIAVFFRSIWLIGKHPRTQTYTEGQDAFGLILDIALLAWVAFVKYGN